MKITVTPVDAFQVELDGIPVGTFKVDSQWNGLTCLKAGDGSTIIAALDRPGVLDFMVNEKGLRAGAVVTASPSILALLPAPAQDVNDGTDI